MARTLAPRRPGAGCSVAETQVLEKGFQLGYPQEQHEWLAGRIRPEAEAFVERPGLSVDSLHDNGACADQVGRRQGAPGRVDQQVRAEAPALAVRVDRKLTEEDDRDRIGHAPADPGRNPPPLH